MRYLSHFVLHSSNRDMVKLKLAFPIGTIVEGVTDPELQYPHQVQ